MVQSAWGYSEVHEHVLGLLTFVCLCMDGPKFPQFFQGSQVCLRAFNCLLASVLQVVVDQAIGKVRHAGIAEGLYMA
jgi:hypothetical protein